MANDDSFKAVWNDSIQTYERVTQRKLSGDDAFRKFHSFADLERDFHRRHDDFDAFRDKHGKLFKGLSKCFRPLLPLLSILKQSLGATPYAPASAAFGAASHLLDACENVTKAYDGVEELFERMADITVRLKEYQQRHAESALRNKMTHILAYMIELLGKAEMLVKRGRFKHWTRSIISKDDEIRKSIETLERFVETELGLVVALTYTRVGQLHNRTTMVDTKVDDVLQNQRTDRHTALEKDADQRIREVLGTEVLLEMSKRHAQNVESMTEGTGRWLQEDSTLKSWEQGKTPFLWILGRPGVGKTILAAQTIENLRSSHAQDSYVPSRTCVSYVYFRDDNPILQDCAKMWKSVALQICLGNDKFKKHVLAQLNNADTLASARRIWNTLFLDFFCEPTQASNGASSLVIVIDGLDEATRNEQSKLVACLAELAKRSPTAGPFSIQIAVFARPEIRAVDSFESAGFDRSDHVIEVTETRNAMDIEAFVKQQLREVSLLKHLQRCGATSEYRNIARQIYVSVKSRSHGMFLWASLVFDQIRKARTPEGLKQALNQAPQGLDEMLHHIFMRLEAAEPECFSYLYHLLMWVLVARRPFSIFELYVLLRLSTGQRCILLEHHLRTLYVSLFDVTESSERDPDGGSEDSCLDDDMIDDDFAGNSGAMHATREAHQLGFDFLDEEDEMPFDEALKDVSYNHTSSITQRNDLQEEDFVSADVAPGFQLPQHLKHSLVTFQHGRIRDFLNIESTPATQRWSDCSLFARDPGVFKSQVLLACIDIMCTNVAFDLDIADLWVYATSHWAEHLAEICIPTPGSPRAIEVTRALVRLFNDSSTMLHISNCGSKHFAETCIVCNIVTANIACVEAGHQDWAFQLQSSPHILFQPLAVACATHWLAKPGWDDKDYFGLLHPQVQILYVYHQLVSGTENSSGDKDAESGQRSLSVPLNIRKIPLETILALSELVPLEKSERWYVGLGSTLAAANIDSFTHRAIECFRRALEIAPHSWIAKRGLATCYGTNFSQQRTGIRLLSEAIEGLPATNVPADVDFFLRVERGFWHLEVSDAHTTLAETKQAYESGLEFRYPDSDINDHFVLLSIRNYIVALCNHKKYSEVAMVFEEIGDLRIGRRGSMLSAFLEKQDLRKSYYVGIFYKAGIISQVVGPEALTALKIATVEQTEAFSKGSSPSDASVWLVEQGTRWLFQYTDAFDTFPSLNSSLMHMINQESLATQHINLLGIAAVLAMVHLRRAIAAKANGENASIHAAQLKSLALQRRGDRMSPCAAYPASAYGHWLREYESTTRSEWMAYIKPSAVQALTNLDIDPWYDHEAYMQLGEALLHANDIENARVALGITMWPLVEIVQRAKDINLSVSSGSATPAEESSPESSDTKYSERYVQYLCDGDCETSLEDYGELHFCCTCYQVCFCAKCYRLLKAGELRFPLCEPNHEHALMFPVSEAASDMTNALREGRFEPQQKWLRDLRETWGT